MSKFLFFTSAFLFYFQFSFSQTRVEKSVVLVVSLMKGLPRPKDVPRGQSIDPDIKVVILNNADRAASFYHTWNICGDNAIKLELTIKDSAFFLHDASYCSTKQFS